MAYFEQLNELNTDGVEPTYTTVDLENVQRADETIDYSLGRDDLLRLAPEQQAGQIKDPKVLQ
jgi:aspartyl-tRNA(Asn)/glutamyl-tRNA(Gln) amidotransferase subunit C